LAVCIVFLWQTPKPTQPTYFFTLNANTTLPDFGIAGSQIIKRYPFDSYPFYSATILFYNTVIFAPFKVLENLNYGFDSV
jgi:hypothetical protein